MPLDESIDEKLYIRAGCSACLGTRLNRNNRICPYCENGWTYLEAAIVQVKLQLNKLPDEDKLDIMNSLKEGLK